jgi:hypothetical protein
MGILFCEVRHIKLVELWLDLSQIKGGHMFDLNQLDENTYQLLKDAARRNELGVYAFINKLVNDAAATEYEKQQIEDARTANA